MEDLENNTYCSSLQPRLLEELDQILVAGKEEMTAKYGQKFVDEFELEVRDEFKKLMPHVPYIGGDANPFTGQLLFSVQFLSLYRVMARNGIDTGEGGIASLKIFSDWLDSLPRFEDTTDTPDQEAYLQQLREWASVSQERLYSGDWVYEFYERGGADGEIGQDITECAILKLYRDYGMVDFVPYICAMDILLSEARHNGLHRTQTLAEGGDKCDFRFKVGRKTDVRSTIWGSFVNQR